MKKLKNKINFFKKDFDLLELIKGSFFSLLGKVLGMGFGYLVILIISNKYGSSGLGIYSLSITVLNIAALVPKFGLDIGLIRILNESKTKGNKKNFFSIIKRTSLFMLLLSVIAMLIVYFSSDIIATLFFHNEYLSGPIKAVSLAIVPITLLVVASSTFQVFKKTFFHMLFKTALINIVFSILLAINIFLLDESSDIIGLYSLACYVAFFIAFLFLIIRLRKRTFISEISYNFSMKRILSISFPMLLANSFVLLLGMSNILLLGYFTTEHQVGVFSATERLAELAGIAIIVINSIAAPKFAEAYSKNDYKNIEEVTQKTTKMIFFLSAPILILLVIFGKSFLEFFGSEFVVGYWCLVILCLGRFFSASSGSVGYILQMTNHEKIFQRVIFLAFVLNFIVGVILIPIYGFFGAAFAQLVSTIFWNTLLIFIIKKRLGFWSFYIPFYSK